MFLSDQLVIDSLTHYALLYHSPYSGLVTTRRFRETRGIIRGVAMTNQPILAIYQTAFEGLFQQTGQHYFVNRCIVESRDSVSLKAGLWTADGAQPPASSLYNYDLLIPISAAPQLYNIMLNDLNAYSGYQARLEKRITNCLILKRTGPAEKLKSTSAKAVRSLGSGQPIVLQKAPLAVFVNWLNSTPLIRLPVFDETGYAEKVDLSLNPGTNYQTLNQALAAYDLQLVPERRLIDLVILRDRSDSTQTQTLTVTP